MLSLNNIIQLLNAEKAKRKKPNWNQNDSTKEDYIENRPFYKEEFEMKFSDEDYRTLFYESTDSGERWYKISDNPMVLDGLDNIVITYGKTADDIKAETMHLVKFESELVENDTSQLVCVKKIYNMSFSGKGDIKGIVSSSAFFDIPTVPIFIIAYDKFNMGYDEDFPKGIYVVQLSDEDSEHNPIMRELIKLYSFSAEKCHKIPSEFLPDDYTNSSQENYIKELLGGAS